MSSRRFAPSSQTVGAIRAMKQLVTRSQAVRPNDGSCEVACQSLISDHTPPVRWLVAVPRVGVMHRTELGGFHRPLGLTGMWGAVRCAVVAGESSRSIAETRVSHDKLENAVSLPIRPRACVGNAASRCADRPLLLHLARYLERCDRAMGGG